MDSVAQRKLLVPGAGYAFVEALSTYVKTIAHPQSRKEDVIHMTMKKRGRDGKELFRSHSLLYLVTPLLEVNGNDVSEIKAANLRSSKLN